MCLLEKYLAKISMVITLINSTGCIDIVVNCIQLLVPLTLPPKNNKSKTKQENIKREIKTLLSFKNLQSIFEHIKKNNKEKIIKKICLSA